MAYVKPRNRRIRPPRTSSSADLNSRSICYNCFRPADHCFCDATSPIQNQTSLLILQHQKERSHPFNTARIAHRCFQNSQLITGRNDVLASMKLPLHSDAALLYPSPDAQSLDAISIHERPSQIVLIDGTWHQAKTLLRDIPAIQGLPRYGLSPATPGQYRIRLEPTDTSLSTVEAAVAALKALEPETVGIERALETFHRMIEIQLAHPQAKYDGVPLEHREQITPNIPHALIHDWENIVIAYGESIQCPTGTHVPIYWVAQRMSDSDKSEANVFQRAIIQPSTTPTVQQIEQHLKLTADDFANAVSPTIFAKAWSEFLRPSDTLVVYNHSTLLLLGRIGIPIGPHAVLKSVKLSPTESVGSLEQRLNHHRLPSMKPVAAGRAGERLAGLQAYAKFLRDSVKICRT